MEQSLHPAHACDDATASGMQLMSKCAGGTRLTAGGILSLAATVALMAAADSGIWKWVQGLYQ